MFRTWEEELDPARGQRLAGALLLAALVLAGGFGFVRALPSGALDRKQEPAVVVAFRPPPVVKKVEELPKPVPPPPKVVKPKPPPAPVAVVAAAAAPPPAPAPMTAPKAVPLAKPPESKDVVPERALAVGGTGDGSGSGAGTGGPGEEAESPPPVVASAGMTGPVNLPEDADSAEPSDDNAMPEYPESARSTGQEAVVILKIVIESDGHVGKIHVMKGEEPFLGAATNAVRGWSYTPARLDGRAISIFKIIKLPFRLRDD